MTPAAAMGTGLTDVGGGVESPVKRSCAGSNKHGEHTRFAHLPTLTLWELLSDKDQK